MNFKKTEIKLNKAMKNQLEEYENVIALQSIYIQSLPKSDFHRILSRSEKLEASRLIRKIGCKNALKYDLPHKVRTIFGWLPELTRNNKSEGVKQLSQATINFVLRMASENFDIGYKTIFGVMRNLGFKISRESIVLILKKNGFPPYKRRIWKFSERVIATAKWHACDFAKHRILTPYGMITVSILFFINCKTRKIHISGFTENPNAEWTKRQLVNASMADWGFLKRGSRLIHDGDPCFKDVFKGGLEASGIESVKTPPYSPNCNAIAERFVKTLRAQCLDRLIFFSEDQLTKALKEYEVYFNLHRNHQGIGNILIDDDEREKLTINTTGKIKRRTFLGGLHHYYRDAA